LNDRIQNFVHRNRQLVFQPIGKVFTFENARDGVFGCQANESVRPQGHEPPAVEIDDGFVPIQNFEDLQLVGFRIFQHLFFRKLLPGCRAAGWIADESR